MLYTLVFGFVKNVFIIPEIVLSYYLLVKTYYLLLLPF